mmetsp:Transcript_103305/g.267145  ORF Transcript_103305/g.267145 Transcript_103305/m.267145 type:complete len:514 (+) Transcript_103305:882-2423(+)
MLPRRDEGLAGVHRRRPRHCGGGRVGGAVQRASRRLCAGEAAPQPLRRGERHGLPEVAGGAPRSHHPGGGHARHHRRARALARVHGEAVCGSPRLHERRLLRHGELDHREGGHGAGAGGHVLPGAGAGPRRPDQPRRPGRPDGVPQHAHAHPQGPEDVDAPARDRRAARGRAAPVGGAAARHLPAAAAPAPERAGRGGAVPGVGADVHDPGDHHARAVRPAAVVVQVARDAHRPPRVLLPRPRLPRGASGREARGDELHRAGGLPARADGRLQAQHRLRRQLRGAGPQPQHRPAERRDLRPADPPRAHAGPPGVPQLLAEVRGPHRLDHLRGLHEPRGRWGAAGLADPLLRAAERAGAHERPQHDRRWPLVLRAGLRPSGEDVAVAARAELVWPRGGVVQQEGRRWLGAALDLLQGPAAGEALGDGAAQHGQACHVPLVAPRHGGDGRVLEVRLHHRAAGGLDPAPEGRQRPQGLGEAHGRHQQPVGPGLLSRVRGGAVGGAHGGLARRHRGV